MSIHTPLTAIRDSAIVTTLAQKRGPDQTSLILLTYPKGN